MASNNDEPKYTPEVARIVRLVLERVAVKLERREGNRSYVGAYKIAAKMVRDAKPD